MIEILLQEGITEVCAKRPDRGIPNQARANRCADRIRVIDESTGVSETPAAAQLPPCLHQIGVRQLLRVRTVECAGIGENGAPEAEIIRHEGKREANFCRGRPEGLAAERITGYRITRADAGRSEATDRLAAFEEVVHRPDILAIPAHDVSANRAALRA